MHRNALLVGLGTCLSLGPLALGCSSSDDPRPSGASGSPATGGRVNAAGSASPRSAGASAVGGTNSGTGGSTTGGASGAGMGGFNTQGGGTSGGGRAGQGGQTGGASSGTGGAPATAGTTGTPLPPGKTGGWATVTGGGDSTPVVATSLGQLNSLAGGSDPKVIHVSGQFSGSLSVGSNKTIIGLPGTKISSGDVLKLNNSKNVIVRNITFVGTPDGGSNTTAVVVSSQHIWLDHNEFVDGGDGMLDIYGSSDFVTVSWNKMRYTGKTAHQAAVLMAVSNGDSSGSGKLNVTFHHNWWAENISERQPRVRFGKVHVYNNLYTATLGFTYYAVRCGWKANVLSENNIFKDFKGIVPYDNAEKSGESLVFSYFDGSPDSVLETKGDVFDNCTARAIDGDGVEGGTFGKGTAFTPTYPYNLDPTDTLDAAVRAGAGPTLPAPTP